MADEKYIEVPVTCQSLDVYYFKVTPEMLEEAGVATAEDLVLRIHNGTIDPFDYAGEWDNCDSEIANVSYEEARVC